MKRLFVLTLCLVACSSSSDPTPTDAGGSDDATLDARSGGPCLLSGAACGDTIGTPCCSMQCAIGPLGQFTCN